MYIRFRRRPRAPLGLAGLAMLYALCAPSASAQTPPAAVANDQLPRPDLTALRASTPIRLDGRLDEEAWAAAEHAVGFVQAEPREGQEASERTEVTVLYDDENLYVGAMLWDSDPAGMVVGEIRKDFNEQEQDLFAVALDTFHDGLNGYVFMTNPEGARGDRQVAGEGREVNTSWDAVWDVRTQRRPDGWSLEMSIPFRALRFDPAAGDTWGLNFMRLIRRKNEIDYWAPIPRALTFNRLTLAGELHGLPSAGASRDLRVKPYVLGGAVRPVAGASYSRQTEAGVDVKYGLTQGLTLDLTANPDFAQVEADEQRVNLTQFSLFFQEKREFFLENSGLFYVGDAARNTRVRLTPTPDEDLLLFYSRRIGLSGGAAVPILGGARLTGQAAGMSIGALAMRTDDLGDVSGNDYAVLRVRRTVSTGSDVGGIFMLRRATEDGATDFNRVYGVDSYIRLPGAIDWSTYVVRTQTSGLVLDGESDPGTWNGQYAWRTSLNREGNFHHIKFGAMQLGENFNADLGFFRRTGIRKYFIDWGLRPRPEALRARGVREMHPHIVWSYYEDLDGRMRAKNLHTGYTFFLNNGGFFELSVNPASERIDAPFQIDSRHEPIPVGSYDWTTVQLRANSDASRAFSANATLVTGGLWNGDQKSVNAGVTFRPTYQFRAQVSVDRTWADLPMPDARFTTTFWTARTNYSFSRDMFVDALVQYDPVSEQFNSNIRFNFIHHPLSDLFIVWNEQRFFDGTGTLPGRSLQIKATQMVAF